LPRVELRGQVRRKSFRSPQPLAQILVAVANRELKAADRALSDLGRRDELGNRRLERLLVGLKRPQTAVEQNAVADREHKQNGHQALDHQSDAVAHDASIRFDDASAISNMAKVVFGLRNGRVMRTATRSPTRPMRPSVKATFPHRTMTDASG